MYKDMESRAIYKRELEIDQATDELNINKVDFSSFSQLPTTPFSFPT